MLADQNDPFALLAKITIKAISAKMSLGGKEVRGDHDNKRIFAGGKIKEISCPKVST